MEKVFVIAFAFPVRLGQSDFTKEFLMKEPIKG